MIEIIVVVVLVGMIVKRKVIKKSVKEAKEQHLGFQRGPPP